MRFRGYLCDQVISVIDDNTRVKEDNNIYFLDLLEMTNVSKWIAYKRGGITCVTAKSFDSIH